LALRQSEFRAAQAGVQEAWSRVLPTLSFSGSGTYLTDPQKGITLKAGSFGTLPGPTLLPAADMPFIPDALHTYFKVGSSVAWSLFTWGKISEGIRLADTQVVLAAQQTEKSSDETRRDLRKAYFSTVLLRDDAAVLEQMEALMNRLMDDRNTNLAQGTVNQEAVLEMRSRLSEVTYQRQKVLQGLQTGLASLQWFTGAPVEAKLLSEPPRTTIPASTLATLQAQAWERSAQRHILENQIELARSAKRIEEASGPLHPDIGLNVQMDFSGQDVPYSGDKWTDTWGRSITITVGTAGTWFDGFRADARVKAADERLQQAQLGLSLLQDALPLQVQQALQAVVEAKYQWQAKTAARALAEERNRNAQVGFANELATREESQGAQLGELSAKLDALGANFQLESALTDLEFLAGPLAP
jgi:outer membrane protein TolC